MPSLPLIPLFKTPSRLNPVQVIHFSHSTGIFSSFLVKERRFRFLCLLRRPITRAEERVRRDAVSNQENVKDTFGAFANSGLRQS